MLTVALCAQLQLSRFIILQKFIIRPLTTYPMHTYTARDRTARYICVACPSQSIGSLSLTIPVIPHTGCADLATDAGPPPERHIHIKHDLTMFWRLTGLLEHMTR